MSFEADLGTSLCKHARWRIHPLPWSGPEGYEQNLGVCRALVVSKCRMIVLRRISPLHWNLRRRWEGLNPGSEEVGPGKVLIHE